jgi:hypothetical protein
MREPRAIGRSLSAVALLVIVIAIAAYAAPLVNIDKPKDKEVITGTADIHVTYTADSASPIERVQVFIDGQLVKDYRLEKPQLQGSVLFRWDFTAATPSRHSISARAQDASGAVGATGIKVEVRRAAGGETAPATEGPDQTPPAVDIYYPAEGQVVSGEIRVKADVSDNVGVRTVVFFLDGTFKTMMMNSPNYSDKIDTTRMADGAHVVQVRAFDAAENEGRSERTFVVQNREVTATGDGASRIGVTPKVTVAPAPEVPPLKAPGTGGTAPSVTAPGGTQRAPESGATGAQTELTAKLPSPPTVSASQPEGGVMPPPPLASAPSLVKSEPPIVTKASPTTSGPVAGASTQAEERVAALAEPAGWVAHPLGGEAGALNAVSPSPAARDVVAFVGVAGDAAARTHTPTDPAWQLKTTRILGQPAVVLAQPSYAHDPVGEPRQSRVAMLPPSRDEGARSKVGMPGLDVQQMAKFRDVKIVFDGKLIPLRAAPEVVDGLSITPLREVFESCDGTLYWFHQEKRVHAVNSTVDMELKIGDDTAKVNGAAENLSLAPYIKNGRTMVPLEFLATTLDVTVSFNSKTGELIISRNDF